MSCDEASERLPGLLTGTLGREAEAETLAHLAACAACRSELAFWAQVAGAVNAMAAELPDEAVETVHESIFGTRTATLTESLRIVGRTLGIARSAFRLAFTMAGK